MASAQDAGPDMPHVVIYAHQTEVPTSHVASAATVITAQEIADKGFRTLGDALRTVPGVAVDRSGGPGTLTEVRIRGAEVNHTLVLIDGVAVNSADTGAFDFADFSLADVDRIEVIRGPQSGLYGAGANAGVISIVTKSGRGLRKPEADGYIEGGTRGTVSAGVNARGSMGAAYGAVGVSSTRTDGFDVSRSGPERDPSHAFTASTKLGVDLGDNVNVEGSVRYMRRFAQSDFTDCATGRATDAIDACGTADADDQNWDEEHVARIAATFRALGGALVQTTSLSDYGRAYRNDGAFGPYKSVSDDLQLEHKAVYTFATDWFGGEKQTVSAVLDHDHETFRDSFFPGAGRDRTGLAGEWLIDLKSGLTLSGALREDWNSAFADATTWRLTAVQRLAGDLRLHASIGKGVTNPTMVEQFGTFTALGFVGNPALRPESSIGWDAGIGKSFLDGRLSFDATYFSARFTDKIADVACPGGPAGCLTVANLPGVSPRQGVELTVTARPASWLALSASYTYTLAQDSTGLEEVRVPRHSGHLDATATFARGRGHATIGIDIDGTRWDQAFPLLSAPFRVSLAPYSMVTASLAYDIRPDLTAYVRADNLFGSRYQEVFSYYAPGFTVVAGLRMRTGG
ncbi:MAG TPA: TonB-dependent receptor [Hyphomicrobiales bacterium]|nr:TonB-dependent receptor [Hyphomicrobiales bacterium]